MRTVVRLMALPVVLAMLAMLAVVLLVAFVHDLMEYR